MITKLQLGTSRLELLPPKVSSEFLNKSWMHFGDSAIDRINTVSTFKEIIKQYSLKYILKRSFQKLFTFNRQTRDELSTNDLYQKTNFKEFHFNKGDKLPFDDNSINFIYSEHFFEHLFLDEALSLFRECYRILKPFGVIRTCVPDADLRTYTLPEPIGFPDIKLPFSHPSKHKTRWSVYSLPEILRIAGFEASPLHFCTKEGQYIKTSPQKNMAKYKKSPEKEVIMSYNYINRLDSLIVDGIKKPPECL